MKCLVIIPAYNEEENIVRVVENLKTNYPMYDYVVINDGSSDDTARICRKRGLQEPFRQGSNMLTGRAMTMRSSLTRTGSTGQSILPRCWRK